MSFPQISKADMTIQIVMPSVEDSITRQGHISYLSDTGVANKKQFEQVIISFRHVDR